MLKIINPFPDPGNGSGITSPSFAPLSLLASRPGSLDRRTSRQSGSSGQESGFLSSASFDALSEKAINIPGYSKMDDLNAGKFSSN